MVGLFLVWCVHAVVAQEYIRTGYGFTDHRIAQFIYDNGLNPGCFQSGITKNLLSMECRTRDGDFVELTVRISPSKKGQKDVIVGWEKRE